MGCVLITLLLTIVMLVDDQRIDRALPSIGARHQPMLCN
jgi:hypothetical protein